MRLSAVVSNRSVPLVVAMLANLIAFFIGWKFTDLSYTSLSAIKANVVFLGLLVVGMPLVVDYAWRRGKAVTVALGPEHTLATTGAALRAYLGGVSGRTTLKILLGPAVGLLVWCLPLELAPTAPKALAITAFIIMYWITKPLDYGITALCGCYLFWALGGVTFSVAFSGFASSTPWFILGVLLLGQATSNSGLARRLGFSVMRRVGTSPARLLFGFILIVWILGFCIPSPNALLATLAPLAIGIITMLGVGPQSNIAKGLFLSLAYMSQHVGKLLLGSGGSALAYGIIAEQTGIRVGWSQWLLAFLPASVLAVVACYLVVRWLYPPETLSLATDEQSLAAAFPAPGPWTQQEHKALGWLLLAITLWATDFWHHIDPAAVAIGVGLCLTIPGIGLLDAQAFKQMNFLLICFIAGALSLGTVLTQTQALHAVMDGFISWLAPLLTSPLSGSAVLYSVSFLSHFILASDQGLVATSLPLLLDMARSQDYNPAAVGLAWSFASTSKLFVYQSIVVVAAYGYGYFTGKDWLKVSVVLSLVQGLILMLLVSLYWPLIRLSWRPTPPAEATVALPVVPSLPSGIYVPGTAALRTTGVSGVHLPLTWAQIERQPGQFDWRSLEQHPAFVSAVRNGKQVGLQVELQGAPGKPAVPAWAQVPQIDGAPERGKTRLWPALWTPQFQTAFARFVTALGQRYDGDPRLAYVVMTEGTAIPYARNPKRWDAAGYSPAGYSAAYQQLYRTYKQAFPRTPLVAAVSHFGQESKAALQSGPEGQALRELLAFAGQQGLHFLVPEVYTRQAPQSIYVRDELLRPVLRQHAGRSQLLVKLDPGALRGKPLGTETLKMVQGLWPEVPVRAVIPTR